MTIPTNYQYGLKDIYGRGMSEFVKQQIPLYREAQTIAERDAICLVMGYYVMINAEHIAEALVTGSRDRAEDEQKAREEYDDMVNEAWHRSMWESDNERKEE